MASSGDHGRPPLTSDRHPSWTTALVIRAWRDDAGFKARLILEPLASDQDSGSVVVDSVDDLCLAIREAIERLDGL